MKIVAIFFILACLASPLVIAQFAGCFIEGPKGAVDLNKATLPQDLKLTGPGLWDIVLNICKPLSRAPVDNCEGKTGMPAVLVDWQDEKKCNHISNGLQGGDIKTTWIDQSTPEKGVILAYNNGKKFTQEGKELGSRCEITVNCDKDKETPLKFDGGQETGGDMVYKFTMGTKNACPDAGTKPPPTGPGSGAIMAPVGIGGLFLILGAVALVAYFVIGTLVRKFYFKSEGVNIIPNYTIWKDMPFLFWDGCLLIWMTGKDLFNRITKRGDYQQLA
jgi:hypothetical protein